MALNGKFSCSLDFRETLDASTLERTVRSFPIGATAVSIADGSGANQVNKGWAYRGSLAATSTTFDLTALPLPNVAGSATGSPLLAFTKIKLLYCLNESTTDGHILYMGHSTVASNQWSAWLDVATTRELVMPGIPCVKGSLLAQGSNPWTVDATHKILKFENAATFTFSLFLLGI